MKKQALMPVYNSRKNFRNSFYNLPGKVADLLSISLRTVQEVVSYLARNSN
ncbi:hypothetical protein KUH03_30970 [Sphingobacterium sp. E70]|uniref:hypothetical protein n=1 Tax=Sphingobacterium sp. E70 TaxID=2853439 RepID=UPI00211D141A|nr:hypothetical protein [Sphingobacterium sp. E70]ULT23559.1 hypothetical protein KUH03_30970 [Sphingobacterium sp. E70]